MTARVKLSFLLLLMICTVPVSGQESTEQEEVKEETSAEANAVSDDPDEEAKAAPVTKTSVNRVDIDIKPPTDKTKQIREDLERYLKDDKLKTMMAGPKDFLVWLSENTSASSKGVVILLPDWQQSITSPKAMNFLREVMPTMGWVTMAIQPNSKPENYPAEAKIDVTDKTVEAATATESTQASEVVEETTPVPQMPEELPLDEYKRDLLAIMTTVMEEAENYPGIFLVIAQGANGALLTQLYKENLALAPDALILLSAYLPNKSDNDAFSLTMAKSHLPILDLSLQRDNNWVETARPLRKTLSEKYIKVVYRQRQLPSSIPGYYPKKQLSREIVGWLKTIGW